ncbi:MAG: hypothetical protein OXB92_11280 [Acidimicrobiaceae bacterium]|nr:hypothetical protein [Acidimicrobiia bacterium]MCY4494425.1 hypothetical protein [Acidimicrobiaceae bacterium]
MGDHNWGQSRDRGWRGAADSKEGVMSFMQERDPDWTLRISQDWPEWFQ